MNSTPKANRKHIIFYGKRNVGKSSIMNKIIGQDISLVSDVKGTTTDPVSKAMELLSIGPVVFIDTGGLDDEGELGILRVDKTMETLEKADFAIYVMDIEDIDDMFYPQLVKKFKEKNIPYIILINKIDLVSKEELKDIKRAIQWRLNRENVLFVSTNDESTIVNLKYELMKRIGTIVDRHETLVGDIVPYGGKVIMVVTIDEEAPKGRLILPQVQLIRDCLDHGIKSYIVRDTELVSALEDLKDVDLVVTDSQIFKKVEENIPKEINLTSFSIIMARQKGDLGMFLEGIKCVEKLKEKAHPRVLIMESCTHNTSHEDIGKVKIPKMLERYIDRQIDFEFGAGQVFPRDLEGIDLVIHCGSCMLNKKTMLNRIQMCKDHNVPITNYGMVLAYLKGILNRAVHVFTNAGTAFVQSNESNESPLNPL